MEPTEQQAAEGNGPETVVDLVEGDILAVQHVTDIHPVIVPANAAVTTHATNFALRGILERGQSSRIRARGRGVARRRSRLLQRFVWAFRVEFFAEPLERALLKA